MPHTNNVSPDLDLKFAMPMLSDVGSPAEFVNSMVTASPCKEIETILSKNVYSGNVDLDLE